MSRGPTARTALARCAFCGTLNRVDLEKAALRPKCGECQRPILLDRYRNGAGRVER